MTAIPTDSDLRLSGVREPNLALAAQGSMLALFVLLVCLRVPELLWQGRFYGEEGSFFFAYAWHMPWTEALFHNLGGYLNIVASGATLLAVVLVKNDWISLENAPYVTEYTGLIFQIFPAILIVFTRADWLAPRWSRPLALLILATPLLTEEVWLHSLHCQFQLAVCAGVILATQTGGPLPLVLFRFALLALGPLCGPSAVIMLPFFVLRTLMERDRERMLQTGALALATTLQLTLFYVHSGSRELDMGPSLLASILLIRHVVLPFFGHDIAMNGGNTVYVGLKAGHSPWLTAALAYGIIAIIVGLCLKNWRANPVWFVLPALTLAAIGYTGAIHAGPALLDVEVSTRYAFVPQVFIGFALLGIAATGSPSSARFAAVAASWIVGLGLVSYFHPQADIVNGPDWRAEVAAWRADPERPLSSWPAGMWWTVDLSPTSPECPSDPKATGAPDYCDQYWEKLQADAFAKLKKKLNVGKTGS